MLLPAIGGCLAVIGVIICVIALKTYCQSLQSIDYVITNIATALTMAIFFSIEQLLTIGQ